MVNKPRNAETLAGKKCYFQEEPFFDLGMVRLRGNVAANTWHATKLNGDGAEHEY
jgi:hypothetical protein